MKWAIGLTVLAVLAGSSAAIAAERRITIPAGQPVPLATTVELSSRKAAKGDLITFRTTEDVVIDGVTAIPKGTEAIGQVIDVQDKGYAGMAGKLAIRPLYLRVRGAIVRLRGGRLKEADGSAGQVASFVFNPLFFSGKTAKIPAATPIDAMVENAATIIVEQ